MIAGMQTKWLRPVFSSLWKSVIDSGGNCVTFFQSGLTSQDPCYGFLNTNQVRSSLRMPRIKGANKAAVIREYIANHPNAEVAQIIEHLMKEHKLESTAQYVQTVLAGVGGGKGKRKAAKAKGTGARRGRPPASAKARPVAAPTASSPAVSVETLIQAKKLAAELGGVKKARAALEALSSLLD
jgi:hypothetical protein